MNLALTQSLQAGPRAYTDEELKAYDGSDPDKPILLAINGTVYDVSNGRRHYGPGGSYHFFSGADASRAFVTNCFKEDITPDMVCYIHQITVLSNICWLTHPSHTAWR